MNFEQHYGELTSDIRLNGITPDANSMPTDKCFLGKKFKKKLKGTDYQINSFMNVCFEKSQSFIDGEVLTWKLQGESLAVYLIESKQLFVKGKHYWAYCVGIIE